MLQTATKSSGQSSAICLTFLNASYILPSIQSDMILLANGSAVFLFICSAEASPTEKESVKAFDCRNFDPPFK